MRDAQFAVLCALDSFMHGLPVCPMLHGGQSELWFIFLSERRRFDVLAWAACHCL